MICSAPVYVPRDIPHHAALYSTIHRYINSALHRSPPVPYTPYDHPTTMSHDHTPHSTISCTSSAVLQTMNRGARFSPRCGTEDHYREIAGWCVARRVVARSEVGEMGGCRE